MLWAALAHSEDSAVWRRRTASTKPRWRVLQWIIPANITPGAPGALRIGRTGALLGIAEREVRAADGHPMRRMSGRRRSASSPADPRAFRGPLSRDQPPRQCGQLQVLQNCAPPPGAVRYLSTRRLPPHLRQVNTSVGNAGSWDLFAKAETHRVKPVRELDAGNLHVRFDERRGGNGSRVRLGERASKSGSSRWDRAVRRTRVKSRGWRVAARPA